MRRRRSAVWVACLASALVGCKARSEGPTGSAPASREPAVLSATPMPSAPLPPPKPATAEVVFVRSQGLEVAVAETTVGQYRRCVDAGACRVPTLPPPKNFGAPYTIAWSRGRDDLPVDQVDWTDANRFCAWARARLPTAEEWDRIVTNGGRTRFPWGDDPPAAKRANLCFLGCENRPGRPVEDDRFANESGPVCAYPDGRNADGVCDLVGNLTEWTSSPYPFHPGVSKQARGSSHNSYPDMAAPLFVHWFDADARGDNIGFRCVRTPLP